eukprot:PhF_6_TR12834/c0_g1_i1/m.20188
MDPFDRFPDPCMTAIAMAFYGDATRRHAEGRLREALLTELTIQKSMSAGRSPSPVPPRLDERPSVLFERKPPENKLQQYVKSQSAQREKNGDETSSSGMDEEGHEEEDLDFTNQALIWNPAIWHMHLTDEAALTTWQKQLTEVFVNCRELKEHPVLKAQAEVSMALLEELARITVG